MFAIFEQILYGYKIKHIVFEYTKKLLSLKCQIKYMCLNIVYLVRYKTYSFDKVRFTLIKGKTHTFDWIMEKQGFLCAK